MKNWIAAAVAIFLAEYHLATGDDSVLEDLQKCCDLLAQRVSDKGTMGHKYEITYNGGGLTIINVQAHLVWVLAARCGCKIDTVAREHRRLRKRARELGSRLFAETPRRRVERLERLWTIWRPQDSGR